MTMLFVPFLLIFAWLAADAILAKGSGENEFLLKEMGAESRLNC